MKSKLLSIVTYFVGKRYFRGCLLLRRIVCKTGAMGALREGAVIATIGEDIIIWETPFKYQVDIHYTCTSDNVMFSSSSIISAIR